MTFGEMCEGYLEFMENACDASPWPIKIVLMIVNWIIIAHTIVLAMLFAPEVLIVAFLMSDESPLKRR